MAAKLLNKETEDKTETAPIEDINKEVPQPDKVESKFAEKSREELETMLTEQDSMIGRQSEEVRDARKQISAYKEADSFIQGQLQKQEQAEPKDELDYFGNPEEAIQKSIENHPSVRESKEALRRLEQQNAAQQILAQHPDMVAIVQDQKFIDWVANDSVRMRLFNEANQHLNIESANYIFNEYKASHNVTPTPQRERSKRTESVRAASTGSTAGSSEPISKKKYRASDIRKLKKEDPKAYAERGDEILLAYREGRVVRN